MFHSFTHRHTPCLVEGVEEKVILSRETKATTVIGKEYVYNGLFSPSSIVSNGLMVESNGDSFLVLTLRLSTEKDKYCSLLKTNNMIEIQRFTQEYDKYDNPIGKPKFITVQSDVKTFAEYITADIRQQDVGLLPTTEYVLDLQKSVDIKRPQDANTKPDRVILNGRAYQVDAVDDVKYPNLLRVQLSEDTR